MSSQAEQPETPDEERPKVRRIESAPVEPVDVLSVAGPAVAKRLIPVVVILLLIIALIVFLIVR